MKVYQAGMQEHLINLKNENDQRKITEKNISKSLSVRQTEELVKSFEKKNEQNRKTKPERDPFWKISLTTCETRFSTKVNIKSESERRRNSN
jgi:ParB family transcriptional regulator, chromosome partitioning protein